MEISIQTKTNRGNEPTSSIMVLEADLVDQKHICQLLFDAGWHISVFSTVQEFREHLMPNIPSCLILAANFRAVDRQNLLRHIDETARQIPIIFTTNRNDVVMAVKAMRAGAIDFLAKPVDGTTLLESVNKAIEIDAARRKFEATLNDLKRRYRLLTPREREVLRHVAQGRLNKQIAAELGISVVTIKMHRGQIMKKLEVKTIPELIVASDKVSMSCEINEGAKLCLQLLSASLNCPGYAGSEETMID